MSYRANIGPDGTPIQQSMTQNPMDYRAQNLDRLMLGIILSVYPSDDEDGNSTAIQSLDRRGHTHECSVLVIQDGSSAYLKLDHVVITSPFPVGIDNYIELLPRGSSSLTTGDQLNSSLHQINPYDLDGDWCVVGFIGGQIDRPFIVTWWPHARNTFDPATSGRGNPNTSGEGQALVQNKRYFQRVNGVETVVTSKGDVYFSTNFAGSRPKMGGESTKGRFSREEVDEGGNVMVLMKPSKVFEWTWDPQEEGVGIQDSAEPELPQTNPATNVSASGNKDNTFITIDRERMRVQVPSNFEVISKDAVIIESDSKVELESSQIKIGRNAEEPLVLGDTLEQILTEAVIQTAMGPASFDAATIARFVEFKSTKHTVE